MDRNKHVLFVDDEPHILEALERMLFPKRREWRMTFLLGAEAALAAVKRGGIGVIVSDMRMPGMDGAGLLASVRQECPDVVRILLSGHTEPEAALCAVSVAHQVLAKPCDAKQLKEALDRGFALRNQIENDSVLAAIGSVAALPSIPAVYAELNRALAGQKVESGEIAAILEKDVAMCAKVLQLVNGGFFGLPRRTSDIRGAVSFLGVNTLRDLFRSGGVFQAAHDCAQWPRLWQEGLQQHSLFTGQIARHLVHDEKARDDAFLAGLLHDMGKIVFASCFPNVFAEVLISMEERCVPDTVVEKELLGVTHSQMGGYLLGLWGLPQEVREAVTCHHNPQEVQPQSFGVSSAVYVANILAKEVLRSAGTRGRDGGDTELDMRYLTALGVAGELPAWRSWAAEQARSAGVA